MLSLLLSRGCLGGLAFLECIRFLAVVGESRAGCWAFMSLTPPLRLQKRLLSLRSLFTDCRHQLCIAADGLTEALALALVVLTTLQLALTRFSRRSIMRSRGREGCHGMQE